MKYLGVKILKDARPMKKVTYCDHRKWPMPSDEDPMESGYLVVYDDDYESWSPAEKFELAYRKVNELPFGHAIEAIKQGYRVARKSWKGWNEANMFIYYVPGGLYDSVTENARKHFGPITPYRAYIALKTAQDDVAMWSPSGSDALAEDWFILEEDL